MLTLEVYKNEFFDDEKQEFVETSGFTLEFEHSLVSLSKWESIWEKPFLTSDEKSTKEVLSYIEQMILTKDVPDWAFSRFKQEHFVKIQQYIDAKQTATWFNETSKPRRSQETITSELVYYWMITYNIPFECQYWHFNRLLTLIKICQVKSEKPKKMSKSEMIAQRKALNEQRRARLKTTG